MIYVYQVNPIGFLKDRQINKWCKDSFGPSDLTLQNDKRGKWWRGSVHYSKLGAYYGFYKEEDAAWFILRWSEYVRFE